MALLFFIPKEAGAVGQQLHVGELNFDGSIVGFERLRYFVLEKIEGDHPFFLLRSKEQEQIEFVVVSPFEIFKTYEFQLPDELSQALRIESPEDALVLCIVNVKKPFTESTLNLIAPLVVNVINGSARQIILNGTSYQAKTRLFPVQGKGA
jgi:flagellar assembly factor FliW